MSDTDPLTPVPGAEYAECPDCDHRLMILPGSSTTITHGEDGSHWVRFDPSDRAERATRAAAHDWTTDDKHDYEWCRVCLHVRQRNGSTDAKPCKGPSRVTLRAPRAGDAASLLPTAADYQRMDDVLAAARADVERIKAGRPARAQQTTTAMDDAWLSGETQTRQSPEWAERAARAGTCECGPICAACGRYRAALAPAADCADCASHAETVNPPQSASPAPLDRERLARAIAPSFGPSYWPGLTDVTITGKTPRVIAAAIADAYEEDRTDG